MGLFIGRGRYHEPARKSTGLRVPSVAGGLALLFASEMSAMYRGAARSKVFWELWMPVDLNAVRRIAHLARIEVSEAETPHLQAEINAILKFVEALDAVNVDGVEPMTSVIPMRLPMREDVVTDGDIAELVLANAPLTEDGFFVVPKVIE
jgi:aspartyl-tRNA(Asn)/glutamyl-tRNA(Gln) amidotransferase subunit C